MAANSQNGFENYVHTLIASGTIDDMYLAHVGNENSGRYPRGSGGRPWQHVAAAVRAGLLGGRKEKQKLGGSNPGQGGTGSVNGTHAVSSQASQNPQAPRQGLRAAIDQQHHERTEARKQEMMARADPREILANQELFTTNELQEVLTRADRLNQLRSKVPRQKSVLDKVDDAFGVVGRASRWVNTGMEAYNTVKKFVDMNDPKNKNRKTIGQAYAQQFLGELTKKRFSDIDPKAVQSAVDTISNITKLTDAAKGKPINTEKKKK